MKNPYQLVSEHNQVLLAPLHCHERCPESFSRLKVLAAEVYHTDDGWKILSSIFTSLPPPPSSLTPSSNSSLSSSLVTISFHLATRSLERLPIWKRGFHWFCPDGFLICAPLCQGTSSWVSWQSSPLLWSVEKKGDWEMFFQEGEIKMLIKISPGVGQCSLSRDRAWQGTCAR